MKDFQNHGLIGKGSFGKVYLVQKNDTGKFYALKSLKKDTIKERNLMKYVRAERDIMNKVRSPFIVGLKWAFQTNEKLCLVMDYCPGGNLRELLRSHSCLTEASAKFYIAEVILAIEALHKQNVIYR